jgi:hypothetical protein
MSAPRFELTLQEDAFSRAEELATVLKIEPTTALGLLCYLWRWALSLTPGQAPTGIVRGRASCLRLEGAARWKGKRGELVDALVELGLVTREQRKLRVKGTKPYADEFRRKEEARKREKERRAAKKQLEAKLGITKSDGLRVVKREPSEEAKKWWQWAMRERARDRYKKGADPFGPRDFNLERAGVPEDLEPPKSFAVWFDERMKEGITPDALCWAWDRYLGDQHFESRDWPLPIFMSDGVYRKRVTRSA